MSAARNREVVIGVTGGIAAYKSAALVSQLVQAGAKVTVVMTESATRFIGPATMMALSGRPVATGMFDDASYPLGAHIELSRAAELLCIAPATANIMAKLAHGLADDLLSTLATAAKCPILLAPAMNSQMWSNRAVQRNVDLLRNDGVQFVGPDEGWLSCRDQGAGRMAAPEAIFAAIETLLERPRIA